MLPNEYFALIFTLLKKILLSGRVLKMIDSSIYGFENLSLIPGSVGAAPIQNIGAYGQDVSKLIKQVDCFNYEDGKNIRKFKRHFLFVNNQKQNQCS